MGVYKIKQGEPAPDCPKIVDLTMNESSADDILVVSSGNGSYSFESESSSDSDDTAAMLINFLVRRR